MEYTTLSPDSDNLQYCTPPTATLSISAIKELTSASWTMMFPDGYSRGISSWLACDNTLDHTFLNIVEGFPRLEEFRVPENNDLIPEDPNVIALGVTHTFYTQLVNHSFQHLALYLIFFSPFNMEPYHWSCLSYNFNDLTTTILIYSSTLSSHIFSMLFSFLFHFLSSLYPTSSHSFHISHAHTTRQDKQNMMILQCPSNM